MKRDEKLHDDIRAGVRIGVSLGEVVVADGTLTGAGVLRLHQMAFPTLSPSNTASSAVRGVKQSPTNRTSPE